MTGLQLVLPALIKITLFLQYFYRVSTSVFL